MKTKDIHISEYNYELPDERIAKFPKAERDHSKLLVYNKGEVGEDIFYMSPSCSTAVWTCTPTSPRSRIS